MHRSCFMRLYFHNSLLKTGNTFTLITPVQEMQQNKLKQRENNQQKWQTILI